MKSLLFALVLVVLCSSLAAIDNRFVYPLGQVRGVNAQKIYVSDTQVLIRDSQDLLIYSTFNAWQPRLEAGFRSEFRMEDVNFQAGNIVYVSSQEASNTVSQIDSLSQLGRIFFINTVIGDKMSREGSTLYVADRYRGIDIINIGRGGTSEHLANFSEKWGIKDFVVEYPYIYALNDFGFVTVDISDQSFPLSIATHYNISNAIRLVKSGNHVYVAAGKELMVLSVDQIDKPSLISQAAFFNHIQSLNVKDNRLYLALGQGGVKILDISDPSRPQDINTFYPPAAALDIALENDYIFVAMGKDGWMVYEYR
jgi:hypothetical protein